MPIAMKNIQVIDGADNCTYSIFAIESAGFRNLFPEDGQDIEFAEDLFERLGTRTANRLLKKLWATPMAKPSVQGIHGTLFYGLPHKKKYYPTKRDAEMITAL